MQKMTGNNWNKYLSQECTLSENPTYKIMQVKTSYAISKQCNHICCQNVSSIQSEKQEEVESNISIVTMDTIQTRSSPAQEAAEEMGKQYLCKMWKEQCIM